jgi:putative methionine-R-sulfoxide reductase with GAF domain
VLDVDSDQLDDFSAVDAHYLEKMMNYLAERKFNEHLKGVTQP